VDDPTHTHSAPRANTPARSPSPAHQTPHVTAPASVLVIFGASGDLTSRKLMPALAELISRGFLPTMFTVVGVARTEMAEDDFRNRMREAIPDAPDAWLGAVERFRYVSGDYTSPDTYARLEQTLGECDVAMGTPAGTGNRLFYYAAPPSTFPLITNGLAQQGLNHPFSPSSFVRVVIEKPYGHDGASAHALDEVVHAAFDESQVYRIDHYLGKETVQNLLALRFANAIFEPLWNRNYVDHVEITVAESIGVGHRGGFYEEAGAMRDIVQNHVMQVLALTLMEAPSTMDANGIRNEKVKALRSIVTLTPHDIEQNVVRAQYGEGLAEGEKAVAYRSEEGVSPHSTTETFVAMKLSIDNWRWAGVPIYLRTGKRLAKRVTEVVMHFRQAPHLPFAARMAKKLEPNSLIVRIQPNAGISLRFGAKVPGQAFTVRTASMDFDYTAQFSEEDLDGYERLLLDALLGDQTLFIRADEVAEAWRIVDPLLAAFSDPDFAIAQYNSGTWGPAEADRLVDRNGHRWRTP
jgi:glucose-6-phosphate 1-dehydrogenase